MRRRDDSRRRPLWVRLLWFLGLWTGGVVVVGAVGYGIKALLPV